MLGRLISIRRVRQIGGSIGISGVKEEEVGQRRRLMISSVRISSKVMVVARIHENESL